MKLNQRRPLTMPPVEPNAASTDSTRSRSPSRPPTQTQILARYTKDPAHLPGQTTTLRPVDDVELLDYLTGPEAAARASRSTCPARHASREQLDR